MSEPHIKITDALGAAQSYLHSMRLMAQTIFNGEGKDFCAFDLLIDSICIEIENAYAAFDELASTRSAEPSSEGGDSGYIMGLMGHCKPDHEDQLKIIDEIDDELTSLQKRVRELVERLQGRSQ